MRPAACTRSTAIPMLLNCSSYTIELYKEIEQISGQSCGVHITGGLMLARQPASGWTG